MAEQFLQNPELAPETRDALPLGQVYLSSKGTSVGGFEFLLDRDGGSEVEIGTPVAADGPEGVMVGTVVDMASIGWAKDPFAVDVLGGNSVLDRRDEVMLATTQVFHSPRLRPARSGVVRPATAEEMLTATGSDRLEWGIPCGVVELHGGAKVAISLDGASLLGNDAAHCLIGGISGQASKTSFSSVLLRSAIAHGSLTEHSVGAIIFNVKGDDLIYLDQAPEDGYELDDTDLAIYAALGVSPTPFPDVTVYAPGMATADVANCARPDARVLRWTLQDLWRYLRYVWPFIAEDEKLSSFLSQFEELKLRHRNPSQRIDSLQKMVAWMDAEISDADAANTQDCWNGRIHVATMRRMRRLFGGLSARLGGLVPTGVSLDPSDVPDEGWRHGQVIVVDIASLDPLVQGLVIARTVERILRAAEDGRLGVEHLVVFADELNAFAPSQGGEVKAVKKILQRVVTQGRYAGISLWGAAQKLSKIDDLIRDNAATLALGRTAFSELDSGAYGRLPGGLAERLATLARGEMAIWHYTLRCPLVIRFPRPAWRTGKGKSVRRKDGRGALAAAGLSTASIEALAEGLDDTQITELVNQGGDLHGAIDELRSARKIDPKRVMLQPDAVPSFDPTNPFDLE